MSLTLPIEDIVTKIATEHPGTPIAQTEPIAHYLLLAANADDRTPAEFEHAIEAGTDPSASAVGATLDLINHKQVRALIYNIQTSDNLTQQIRAAAEAAGIPVVEVTETLPAGLDFIQWQTRNAEKLAAALG